MHLTAGTGRDGMDEGRKCDELYLGDGFSIGHSLSLAYVMSAQLSQHRFDVIRPAQFVVCPRHVVFDCPPRFHPACCVYESGPCVRVCDYLSF